MKAVNNIEQHGMEGLGTGVENPVGRCMDYIERIVGRSKESP